MSKKEEAWTERYRPSKVSEVQGNTKNLKKLKRWVTNFSSDNTGGKLLHGPPGVGKSSSIQAIANELDMNLLEINASDARRTDEVAEFAHEARMQTIDGEHQLVMLDEIDSMSGRSNLRPLYELLEDAPNPIVCVCNELYQVPNGVKDRCEELKFNLGTRSIKAKLKKIAKSEDLDIGAATLTQLSQRESLRDAIQDLQLIMDTDVSEDEVRELKSDNRDYEQSVFDEVENTLKARPDELDSLNSAETPDSMTLWLDQNMRGMWEMTEAMVGWDTLSRADKYLERTSGDDYRWWKYTGDLNEQLVNLRLSEPYDGYTKTQRPEKFKRKRHTGDVRSLYEKLSGRDVDVFRMGASFRDFRMYHLKILKELEFERKCEIALEHDLSTGEMGVLGLSSSEFESWKEGESGSKDSLIDEQSESVGGFAEW